MLRYRDEARTLEWLGFGRGRRPDAGPGPCGRVRPAAARACVGDVYRLAYYLTRSVA